MSVSRRLFAAAGLAAMLAGCATDYDYGTTPPPVAAPPPVVAGSAPPPPQTAPSPAAVVPGIGSAGAPGVTQPQVSPNYPRSIQESDAGAAVLSLYKQAQQARAASHPDQAEALLERALHIDSRNAFIWQSLAGVRLDLNHPDQAVSTAQKSSSLARGNPYIVAGNWRLIAAARQALGDAGGASEAEAQADGIARTLPAASSTP
jgi:tetratricopeptide (TPR) repeat protein